MYNSIVFNIFTDMCSYHHSQFFSLQKDTHTQQRLSTAVKVKSKVLLTAGETPHNWAPAHLSPATHTPVPCHSQGSSSCSQSSSYTGSILWMPFPMCEPFEPWTASYYSLLFNFKSTLEWPLLKETSITSPTSIPDLLFS